MCPAPTPRELSDADRIAWLRLARSEGVGPATFRDLIERYGTATAALEALPELARRAGRDRPPRILSRARAEDELAAVTKLGGGLIAACEPLYPEALAAIPDAPPVLTWRGDPSLLAQISIAIVGARNASAGGCRLAETLARELGEAGLVVVSGLARGIDAAAHRGALATGTIAVFAGGLDVIYPAENEVLAAAIAERGLLLAELAPGTQPLARNFPRRNRIVAGLARGTLVVEAAIRSGSLTTARLAAEQGREVMAIPGSPLDPRCRGANRLIRDGAALVEEAIDILEILGPITVSNNRTPHPKPSLPTNLTVPPIESQHIEKPTEITTSTILERLGPTPVPVDELIRQCSFSAPVVRTVLLELELAGRLERHPGDAVSMLPI
jgi:DNA processing protein